MGLYLTFDRMNREKPKFEMQPSDPALRIGDTIYVYTDKGVLICLCVGLQIIDGLWRVMVHIPVAIIVDGGLTNVLSADLDRVVWHNPGQWHIHLETYTNDRSIGEINWK